MLVKPLVDQGIRIRTTPVVRRSSGDRTAVASGGALEIEAPLDVQGYPGTLALTLGRATRGASRSARCGAATTIAPADAGPAPRRRRLGRTSRICGGTHVLRQRSPVRPDRPDRVARHRARGLRRPITELVSVPVGRQVEDWDVTTLYRVMLLGGIALFAAGRVVVRTTLRPQRRPTDLRQLWRW